MRVNGAHDNNHSLNSTCIYNSMSVFQQYFTCENLSNSYKSIIKNIVPDLAQWVKLRTLH